MRDLGDGNEKIANPILAAELRARARMVWMLSVVSAISATAIVLAVVIL